MKRKTLQQHKEVALVCEEGIFKVEVISNLLVPHSSKDNISSETLDSYKENKNVLYKLSQDKSQC